VIILHSNNLQNHQSVALILTFKLAWTAIADT